jgi:hypothetical protein
VAEPAAVAVEEQPQSGLCIGARGSESTESVPREDSDDRTPLVQADENDVKHVSCLVDSLPSDLTPEQRQQAEDFIRINSSSFSKSEFDLGLTTLIQHRIDTGDCAPFKEPLRCHPLAYLPVIDEHVDRMLEADVTEPHVSPWASNVVLIKKKNNSLRFCIDYRRLNSITTKESYP